MSENARMRSVEEAYGFKEFSYELKRFMRTNNFKDEEIQSVLHLINSYYFMGFDIENFKKEN